MATLLSLSINVREVASLETINVIKLPQDFSGPLIALAWSPTSRLILVAAADQIVVVSAVESGFRAIIGNPAPPGAKPAFIAFGSTDSEVCVSTSFGLKFTIYNLVSSTATEVSNPKFYAATNARKGFSFRPDTGHLAIMTRVAGKDVVSIHHPVTRELQRSWYPDTVDAQGIIWTPDNRWLAIWESAGQGHKVLFYSADGNLFKAWSGPQNHPTAVAEAKLGAGVKLMQFSPVAGRLAIADYSRCISLVDVAAVNETMRLQHPGGGITPLETLQVMSILYLRNDWSPKLQLTPRSCRSGKNVSQILQEENPIVITLSEPPKQSLLLRGHQAIMQIRKAAVLGWPLTRRPIC